MPDIAIIGARDAVIGFKAVGVAVYPAETPAEARPLIHQLCQERSTGGVAVLFVTEELYQASAETINTYKDNPLPAIIPIPGSQGSVGIGMAIIRANMEKAIGADILFGERR
ncbi:MAG: V-type ATP synthase subunit F [Symbiobacteriaceae bacterium]|nr:V-type ATP synthase subunit F [Symbiobacteriaceae bacterium]